MQSCRLIKDYFIAFLVLHLTIMSFKKISEDFKDTNSSRVDLRIALSRHKMAVEG